jgi:hypothetical protein
MTIKKSGNLQYTARAFKQDSEDAMKGDVVRALIELITNADDAYNSRGGTIQIRLLKSEAPYQVRISVHDKATGLDAEGLEKAFARLGDVNQKFVGDMGTRGLFGRGAKDVAALGKARFASIRAGRFSSLEIDPVKAKFNMEDIDESPTKSAYEECLLKEGESGLTAELFVSTIHRIPSATDMVAKLQTHVQLRDLLNRNEVFYFDERSKLEIKLNGLVPTGEKVIDQELIIPKYKHPVKIEIYRLTSKETSTLDEYSVHGMVVSGRGAAYENSFLHLSKRPEAGWFCGRLDAPEIHDLARSIDSDKEASALNPTRIVSRQRDGLVQNHPYFRALGSEVEKVLKPLFDAMAAEEGAQRKEGDKLRKRFDAVSQVLANTLQEILDEADAGELPTSSDEDGSNFSLSIIPPRRVIKIGETVSLTVRAPENFDLESIKFALASESTAFEIVDVRKESWNQHPRLPVKQRTIRVLAKSRGTGILSASSGDVRAECELIAVAFEPVTEVEPESLIFDPFHFKVAPTKSKNLTLRGPLEYVGELVEIQSSISGLQVPSQVRFKSSKSGKSAEILIRALAGIDEGEAFVTAKLDEEITNCSVTIVESARNKNPKIKIEVVGNDNPPRRVDTLPEDGQLVIRIYGRHRSISKVLGKSTPNGFENETTPAAQASIVEIVAQQLSIYAVERDSEKNPDRYPDAPSIFYKQQEFIPRFIVALQSGLLDLM